MHKPGEPVRKYEKGYGEISLAIQSLLDFIREQAKQNAKKRRVASKTIRDLKTERDAALSTIAKVRELHRRLNVVDDETDERLGETCEVCGEIEGYEVTWPCPTIRALGSVPSTGEGNE